MSDFFTITVPEKVQRGMSVGGKSSGSTRQLTIPTPNTIVDFTMINMYKEPSHMKAINSNTLPKNWDISKQHPQNNLIATPGNQYMCGSCWAIATAGFIGDNYVVSNNWCGTEPPNISTTWSLSCFPQLQCGGGNPGVLVDNIIKYGITTNHCVDYSWCKGNSTCTNPSSDNKFSADELPDKT